MDPELVETLERELLRRTLDRLSAAENNQLNRLSVYRQPFKRQATELLFADNNARKKKASALRRKLIHAFLLEQYKGKFDLHPLMRAIGRQRLRANTSRHQQAHATAARYYARQFEEQKQNTKLIALGDAYVEAKYHYLLADDIEGLRQVAWGYEKQIRGSITQVSPVPKDPAILDERIAILSALLAGEDATPTEVGGSKGLDYHLARCLHARKRLGDLERAIAHGQNALSEHVDVQFWEFQARLLVQAKREEEAIELLQECVRRVPPERGLFSPYKRCAELMTKAGRIDDAITLLQEGIPRIPPEHNSFALYTSCAELMTKAGRIDDAITLLQEGIPRIPTRNNGYLLE
ncbi:MAG: hypothetical protein AAF639_47700, partial [Chloroflexota bacterium]